MNGSINSYLHAFGKVRCGWEAFIVDQNQLPNERHPSTNLKLRRFRVWNQHRRKTGGMRPFVVRPPPRRSVPKLFQILQRFRPSSGHLEEDQENRPATEKFEMVGGNGPAMLFAQTYPWPRGVEDVCGKKWLFRICGIIRNGKGVATGGIVIVVRQLANFIPRQRQSSDNFCDPLPQLRAARTVFVGWC